MQFGDMFRRPIRLVQNRIYRFYPGGREIEKFRGNSGIDDDMSPEAWVGSTTLTFNHDSIPDGKLGYAQAYMDNNEKVYLKDIIDSDPVSYLGEKHVLKFGLNISVLVKLLDAQKQLGLQCHPSRPVAKKFFNSDFGKVESWYVIGLREDQDEDPYLLLGFKEGITREKFQELFLKGDIAGMENWCHKIKPTVGEMYYVAAGTPHAIGPGCFVIEVQEPSDITVGSRLKCFENDIEKQRFIERTMESYEYTGRDEQNNLSAYRVCPKILNSVQGGKETLLLGSDQISYFSVTRLNVAGSLSARDTGTFSILIVIGGAGRLKYNGGFMDVKKGDELFLPAGASGLLWEADEPMSIICCYPPEVL
jgi:mannose-6-phosphate isomerase